MFKYTLRSPSSFIGNGIRWSKRLFGTQCIQCLQTSQLPICGTCLSTFRRIENPCIICGDALLSENRGRVCGDCLSTPKPFRKVVSAFAYTWPLNNLIHRFKNTKPHPLGTWLANQMLLTIEQTYADQPLPKYIIPVPSHWRRIIQRGYNPAHYLAEIISTELNIPIANVFCRSKQHSEQKKLNRQQRIKNLRHAFEVVRDIHTSHVVIIDDVVTSTATVCALAYALRKNHVETVDVWCVARTAS